MLETATAAPKLGKFQLYKPGSGAAANFGWHTSPIGGGGVLAQQTITCDRTANDCSPGVGTVTKMSSTDIGGAVYWYNSSSSVCGNNRSNAGPCWQNILTPKNGFNLTNPTQAEIGARDVGLSPHNTQVVYVLEAQSGCLYKSTTGPNGTYSTVAGWTCFSFSSTPNGGNLSRHAVVVDPVNEAIVYASYPAGNSPPPCTNTPTPKAFASYNGGTTFTDLSTLGNPVPTSTVTCTGVTTAFVFDSSNGTTVTCPGSASICTKNVFVVSNGNGFYKSVDGGLNFTSLAGAGAPGGCLHINVDPAGDAYCYAGNPVYALFRWVPSAVGSTTGTWSTVLTITGPASVLADFAVDYNTGCTLAGHNCRILAVQDDGSLNESDDSGATWPIASTNLTVAATDVPWLQASGANTGVNSITAHEIAFDPTQSNVLTLAAGAGYWTTTPPASNGAAFVWTSQTKDIEELLSQRVIAPPGFGGAVVGVWDRGVFPMPSQTVYPSFYAPNENAGGNRGLDVANSQDFTTSGLIVQINADGNAFKTTGIGNGAPANWSQVATVPSEIGAFSGGVMMPFDVNKWIWVVGKGGHPFYTANGGGTWTQFASTSGWSSGQIDKNAVIDKTADVAYIQNNGSAPGIYKFNFSSSTPTSVLGCSSAGTCGVTLGNGNIGVLITVPSTAGNMYFSTAQGSGTVPLPGALYECTDSSPGGTSANTVTCQTVVTTHNIPGTSTPYGANVTGVQTMACGKGSGAYSGCYFYGSIDGSTVGIYQTYDHFQTFTQVSDANIQGCGVAGACSVNNGDTFPGRWDSMASMAASVDTQGLIYLCFQGTACIYGQFN